MVAENFLFLQASYDEQAEDIVLWCKDKNENYVRVKVAYHMRVFVEISKKQFDTLKLPGEPAHRQWGHEKREGYIIPLKKIPADLLDILLEKGKIYEHDIEPARKFLLEHKIATGNYFDAEGEKESDCFRAYSIKNTEHRKQDLSILAFDIETYSPGFNIVPEKYPIIMIAAATKEKAKGFSFGKHMQGKKDTDVFDDEISMLKGFLRFVEEQRPDIIVGYNSDRFDWWYILKRANQLNTELMICGNRILQKNLRARAVRLPGPVHVDLYPFCRNALRTTLKTQSFSLNDVGEELVGKQKIKVDLSVMHTAWDKGLPSLEEFMAYNIEDARLTQEIAQVLLPNMNVFSELVAIDLADITRMGFAALVEHFLITRAFPQAQLVPNLPKEEELKKRIDIVNKGGFVYEPTPGLYHNVIVADFASIYPSIIASHNLDPALTKSKTIVLEENKEKRGFIPETITELINARNKVKADIKKIKKTAKQELLVLQARSQNLKVLANAMYGYLSFEQSRWYNPIVAGQITAYGRKYVQFAIEETKKAGFQVLYSDTDSLFLTTPVEKTQAALDHIQKLDDKLPGIMHLDLDGIYHSGIFVGTREGEGAKKKYALYNKENGFKITGFETIRHDWSVLARDAQRELLTLVLTGKPEKEVTHMIARLLEKIEQRRFTIEEMTITTKLRKALSQYKSVGPHVTAAQRMITLGNKVDVGTIIPYVIVKGTGTLSNKTRLPQEVKIDDIDLQYYIENQVKPVLLPILEVIKVKFPGHVGQAKQRGLGDF